MINAEWDVASSLVTPAGTLTLNQAETEEKRWLLAPKRCTAVLPVRATADDVPQGSGQIPHKRWRGGYLVHLAIEFWSYDKVACDAVLVEMLDELGLHLNAMENTGLLPGGPEASFRWQPTGQAQQRRIAGAQLLGIAAGPSLDGEGGTSVEFDIDTALPYALGTTEEQTPIGDGTTVTVTNTGNAKMYPIIRVDGPASTFWIINHDTVDFPAGNELQVAYDTALPGSLAVGGGDYAEFDLFRKTVYLNGNETNLKAGVDPLLTDWFPLVPGDNEIEVVGADATILHYPAWA